MISQFHHPRGLGGRLAGQQMAHRPSNVRRNLWVVSLLDVRPDERVLEVGFGPGIAIAELARRVTRGRVYGVDHSAVMVRQARRRSAAAVRAGRVDLREAPVSDLPDFGAPLDAVMAVNSAGFWPDPVTQLERLRARLRPGGRIALAGQPRCPGATAETTARAAGHLTDLLTQAGFVDPRTEILPLTPPVACVLARNPGAGAAAGHHADGG
jgi:SAM-dependent methyltransferase